MGFLELAFMGVAAAVSFGVIAVAHRVLPNVARDPRPRLTVLPFVLLLGALVVAGGVAAVAPTAPLVEALVGKVPGSVVLLSSGGQPMHASASNFYFYAVATPALSAMAWWLLTRSTKVAMASFIAGAGAFVAGAGVAFSIFQPAMELAVDAVNNVTPVSDASYAVESALRTMFGFGFGGAATAGVAVVAASSVAGLRSALLATLAAPVVVLVAAGLATPPDLLSQMLVAAMLFAAWMGGFGSGAAVGWLYRRLAKT